MFIKLFINFNKMTNTTQLTNTIFKSSKILFETKNDDYRYVKTKSEIKKGELILIEHCYCHNNIEQLRNVILNSPDLFNNLYPRKTIWNENMIQKLTDEVSEMCCEKAQKNAFGIDEKYMIGLDISRFNHSITPNASVKYLDINIEQEVNCCLLYVYAHNTINTNDDINISYGNAYFGENVEQIDSLFKLENNYINKIAQQYITKEICKNIVFNHICIFYGLYLIDDIICPTKRFSEYFTKHIKKECKRCQRLGSETTTA